MGNREFLRQRSVSVSQNCELEERGREIERERRINGLKEAKMAPRHLAKVHWPFCALKLSVEDKSIIQRGENGLFSLIKVTILFLYVIGQREIESSH